MKLKLRSQASKTGNSASDPFPEFEPERSLSFIETAFGSVMAFKSF